MEPMKVIIKEREVEYISDYPDGWKFSAGDPFKFPVLIGDSPCFVKRFEQKTPQDISGWDLLIKMSGKYEKNLSRIYDVKNVTEDDKEIYYVFYEYLDGVTFDKYIREPDINLIHLNNDLFNAVRALQKYEFWFADFCEKNIFCQKDGTFVLVDVDSTQRTADLPDNEMYGSKDYWILVFKFFKEILNKNDIRLADINGISLNYLQIPFLVLRLKLFINGDKKDYNSTELFNKLPSQLIEMAPEFRQIYLNVIKNGIQPLSEKEISTIKEVVERRIIKTDDIPEVVIAPVSLPVIKAFNTSSSTIESGGAFTLSWQIENANKLELYKNGAMFKALNTSEKEIALTGFADGTRQQSSYQLYAYKDLAMAKSDPIIIKLKETEQKKRNPMKIIGIVLGVIALAAASFFLFHLINPDSNEPYIKQKVLRQGIDSTITVYGKNLPSKDKIIILINDTKGTIISGSKNSLLVLLPKTKFTVSNDSAYVFVNFNNKTKNAGLFMYVPPVVIKQRTLYEDSIFTFYGKNLNTNNIKVLFENKEIPILSQSENGLTIKVPELEDTLSGHLIKLLINEDNNTIFSRNCIVSYDTIDLIRLAPQARWMAGILLSDGNSSTNNANLIWPGNDNEPAGFARSDVTLMENAIAYPVLRMHPMWLSNGTIKGFFPWSNLKGKKTFKAQVGFLQNGRSTDGVVFQVWVHYHLNQVETLELIKRQFKGYTGRIANFFVDFPQHISNDFFIELRVDAGNESNSDWAAWINPIVISRRLRVSATQ
jgi:hypothetical protein